MLHEHVGFDERVFVAEDGDSFSGGEFAFFVLGVDSFLAAAEERLGSFVGDSLGDGGGSAEDVEEHFWKNLNF